jgi:DNA repair exonuclease SbcCD ATPase subunit
LLVEQGLLTDDELEQALATQQQTGERLGETIVKCGFVSGPELAAALAAQYGIELTTEKGFGTGLRSEIQRRHENDRRRIVQIVPDPPARLELVPDERAPEPEPEPEPDAVPTGEAMLLAQLEEQWAKLAAAEEALAERERELAELAERRDRDREELAERALELTERAESRERELAELAHSRERELAELARCHEGVLAELAERERELIELKEQRKRERVELAEHSERERAELTETREHELAEVAESHRRELAQLVEVNERLREQLEELRRAQVAAEEESAPLLPTSHLVFVQLDERYELISRDGPPPEPLTPLYLPDVDEGSFVVAGSRRSPFPGDARPCVVALRG